MTAPHTPPQLISGQPKTHLLLHTNSKTKSYTPHTRNSDIPPTQRRRTQHFLSRNSTNRYTHGSHNAPPVANKFPHHRTTPSFSHVAHAPIFKHPSYSPTLRPHLHNASVHLPTPTTPHKCLEPSPCFKSSNSTHTCSPPQQNSACYFLHSITSATVTGATLNASFNSKI